MVYTVWFRLISPKSFTFRRRRPSVLKLNAAARQHCSLHHLILLVNAIDLTTQSPLSVSMKKSRWWCAPMGNCVPLRNNTLEVTLSFLTRESTKIFRPFLLVMMGNFVSYTINAKHIELKILSVKRVSIIIDIMCPS